MVTGTLDIAADQGQTATVTVVYDDYEPNAEISLTGTSEGKTIVATAP